MTDSPHNLTPVPRWVHYWAVFTAVMTAVLLATGAVVTTFSVGMADPEWPTSPWYLLFVSWKNSPLGFLIEHNHRFTGYAIGCWVIVLAVALWFTARRPLLRWLGLIALGAIILQGLLGGFRVVLNQFFGTDLAIVHGCFAQLVFTLLVGIAVMTSSWGASHEADGAGLKWIRDLGALLFALVFVQLIWGALVRHGHGRLAQRLHFLTAFAVTAAAALLARAALANRPLRRLFVVPVAVLITLVSVQLALGVEAWLSKFANGTIGEYQPVTAAQAVIRTAHVLIGSWVLATAAVLTVLAHRAWRATTAPEPASAPIPTESTTAIYPAPSRALQPREVRA